MTNKLPLWIIVFILNLNIALAQSGLFSPEGSNRLLIFGVSIIVIVIVIRNLFKSKVIKF